MKKVVIAGSGNAALCAGIAALEQGAEVIRMLAGQTILVLMSIVFGNWIVHEMMEKGFLIP